MRLLLFVLLPLAAQAADLSGRIVGVHDGDTVTLLDHSNQQHKIRLAGIDAPELHQAFGQKSKANLALMVFDKEVVAECAKVDRYRREICVIRVAGKDANLAQVVSGMAWWYRHYAAEQAAPQRADYAAAENYASQQRLGLWSENDPVPPWEWRRKGRQ